MSIRPAWRLILALASTVCASSARAAITPACLFTDNAVLQRNIAVPVWGTADPGEPIAVSIAGRRAKTVTSAGGDWFVKLSPLPTGGPYTMTIAGKGDDRVTLSNVLVGEVWICGGQSNMSYPMAGWTQPAITKDAIPQSADPLLHFVIVSNTAGAEPHRSVGGTWKEATVDTVPALSAVGYFFGRDLRKALKVPIGLIHDNWGGTPAQAWTSREALEAVPELRHYLYEDELYPSQYPGLYVDYNAKLDKYNADKAAGKNPQQAPRKPAEYDQNPNLAAHLYNGMIAPIIPYAIRGAIWYQGEANASSGWEYKTLLTTMITDWRKRWGEGDFPFYIVQLAPFMAMNSAPMPRGQNGWPDLREAQRQISLTCPHTGMAVITDIGDEKDVHPRRKEPVGTRLALIARSQVYGDRKLEYSGPQYQSIHISRGRAVVSFTHAAGLKAIEVRDSMPDGRVVAEAGKLVGFELAGEDGTYYAADAVIDNDTIVVSSSSVQHPVAVRYGWANYPIANLSNGAGLPASPFKSDNWPWASQPQNPVPDN